MSIHDSSSVYDSRAPAASQVSTSRVLSLCRGPTEGDPAAVQVTASKAIFSEPATVVHLDDVEGCTHEVSYVRTYIRTYLVPVVLVRRVRSTSSEGMDCVFMCGIASCADMVHAELDVAYC